MKKLLLLMIVLVLCLSPMFAEKLEFTTTDLSGKRVDQSIFKSAKVTMVNIWGTFCPPCIQEMPDLARLNREIDNFQVVGFVIDAVTRSGKPSPRYVNEAMSIIMKTGAAYTHILPTRELMSTSFKDVQAVPTTFFVDSEGNIIAEYVGGRDYKGWKEIIESYL